MGCHQAKTLPVGPRGAKALKDLQVRVIPFPRGRSVPKGSAGVAFATAYELVHKEKMCEEACVVAKVIMAAAVTRSHGQLKVVCTKLSGDIAAELSFRSDATILDLKSEIASRCNSATSPQFFSCDNVVDPGGRIEQYVDTLMTICMEPQEGKLQDPDRARTLCCERILSVIGRSCHTVGDHVHFEIDVMFRAGSSKKVYCQCVELILLCHALMTPASLDWIGCHAGERTYTVTSAASIGAAKLQGKTCQADACCANSESQDDGYIGGIPVVATWASRAF